MSPSTDYIVGGGKSGQIPPIDDFLSSAADLRHRAGGSFSDSQNSAIHITALVAASLSLVIALIALRWFVLMRRSFRHQLVMFLIISDTSKALWYFIFSVVIFTNGPINSSTSFCQASGYLLQFSLEACDMAIFMIALHSILYIKHPTSGVGEGGLYPYRKCIPFLWLGPPLLLASLAFVYDQTPYVTAGTFCFLPKRPFWYRLALSWVPRYLIISMILCMYIWIYVYIHIKFRGFENFTSSDSSDDSQCDSGRESQPLDRSKNVGRQAEVNSSDPNLLSTSEIHSLPPAVAQNDPSTGQQPRPQAMEPWDKMTFATTGTVPGVTNSQPSLNGYPGMTSRFGSAWSGETQQPSLPGSVMDAKLESSQDTSRKCSASRSGTSRDTEELKGVSRERLARGQRLAVGEGLNDQLRQTRAAIRKQLRYLFIYPLVYIIMWSFPFASHALSYSDYYVMHPIFWLAVLQTAMLALQAGVDSIVFSWMERPWRRIDGNSRLSIPFLKRQSKALLERRCAEKNGSSRPVPVAEEIAMPVQRNPHWWEAEGRRRNDSVWLGTSTYAESIAPAISTTRTRSRSPENPAKPRLLHTRTRSSEKQVAYIPTLESIPTDAPSSADGTPDTPQPNRGPFAPMNWVSKSRGHRRSLSANTLSKVSMAPPPTVPEVEGEGEDDS